MSTPRKKKKNNTPEKKNNGVPKLSCPGEPEGPASQPSLRQVRQAGRQATQPARTWSSQAHILGPKWSLSVFSVAPQSGCFRFHLERDPVKNWTHQQTPPVILQT